MNIYVELTREFNEGKLRAILSSGQAVVLHRLAVMSKDGDWILREDEESLGYVRSVLERHGARYRYGAPLDVRWLAGGWSAHFEFRHEILRVRTDFVTRPPRLSVQDLEKLWNEQEGRPVPFLDPVLLAKIKKTNREKDYAVIGELARLMKNPADQLLHSRSARDLAELAGKHPDIVKALSRERPLLEVIDQGRDALERALDAERRDLMRANEERLARFLKAALHWRGAWPGMDREVASLPLSEAHGIIARKAEGVLPFTVGGESHGS